MQPQTAIIKVLCKGDGFEEAANLVAWTVGHRVEIGELGPEANTRWVLILTDLAYHHDDDTILERLGLQVIGKVSGVLYWEVVPSGYQWIWANAP